MKYKIITGTMLVLLLAGISTLTLEIQPTGANSTTTPTNWIGGDADVEDAVEAQPVPANYSRIHGHVYKNHTLNNPLRGIVLELWDNSSNTLVVNTTSLDSDLDPGAFDFGEVFTGPNRTFFIRIVVEGYNSTGYSVLEVIDETTGNLIHCDSPAFTCYSEQDYDYGNLYGPDEGDATTFADQALNHYYYIWLVYDYFRKKLFHFIDHVKVHILPSGMGAWAGAYDLYFPKGVNLYYVQAIGHEYGHSIMFQIYDPWETCNSTQGHTANHADVGAWDYCQNVLADPDFGNTIDPVPCSGDALSEGWAHFVSWVSYGAYIYAGGGPWSGMALDVRQGAGEKNEFGFTAILHDIYCIPRQDKDTMLRYIWEVLSKDHPGSVIQFYDAFVTRYPELADEVKIAYMRHYAVFSRLGIEVKATENGAGLHVNVSGFLMPFPHPNKTVTVKYRPVGEVSWSWLANVTTDSSSFYFVTEDLPEGVYEFQASWPGDRDHHTGHYGSESNIARTDELYIGSVNGLKIFTDKNAYYPGDTVQIKILNTNYTHELVTNTIGECALWSTFHNFSYADFYLQIFYPTGILAWNQSLLVPPFYGMVNVNFTNTMMVGSYIVKIFNDVMGSVHVSDIVVIVEKFGLTAPLIVAATTVLVYVKKRKRKRG